VRKNVLRTSTQFSHCGCMCVQVYNGSSDDCSELCRCPRVNTSSSTVGVCVCRYTTGRLTTVRSCADVLVLIRRLPRSSVPRCLVTQPRRVTTATSRTVILQPMTSSVHLSVCLSVNTARVAVVYYLFQIDTVASDGRVRTAECPFLTLSRMYFSPRTHACSISTERLWTAIYC